MKVLVVNNAAPFVRGGAELLAENLVLRLNAVRGVESELLRIPFKWEPAERLIEEVLLSRQLQLVNVDQVIALKFPAYLIPHPNKTLWILHQFRQAYDLYDVGQSHLGMDERGQELVRIVRAADAACFAGCRRIYANSPVTKDRLRRFSHVQADVLYPPLNDPELFDCESYDSYIFAGGRLSLGKRQHLLIEAMQYVKTDIKLVVAGPADTEDYATYLRELVASWGLAERVALEIGYHDRSTIARYVNNCLFCAAIPFDEDSLSYVAMEAFSASKAVVTTADSGGLLEIVVDGVTGVVVAPDAKLIAAALERLVLDRKRAQTLGKEARAMWIRKGITWDTTIESLLDR